MIKNKNGEVADLVAVSQFEPGESQSECGPFAVALCKFAGPPNAGARGSAEDVDTLADNIYDSIFSNHTISTEQGVVPEQIHTMLLDAGLHYQDLVTIQDGSTQDNDIRYIKAALDAGYLVIGEIFESSVVDREFGGSPYAWNTSGLWHYVVYSGYDGNSLLVHDGANVNGLLNGANQPRPQPRHYDPSQIQNRWCTIVWNDWLPRMPENYDPTQQRLQKEQEQLLQLTDPIGSFFTQSGTVKWTCKANKIDVQGAILMYFCQIGGSPRLPQTPEQYDIPGVVWQRFEAGIIVYDPQQKLDGFTLGRNHTYMIKLDSELATKVLFGDKLKAAQDAATQALAAKQASDDKVLALGKEVAELKAAQPVDKAKIKSDLNNITSSLNNISAAVADAIKVLN